MITRSPDRIDSINRSPVGVRIRVYSNHGSTKDTQNIGGDWGADQPHDYQEGDLTRSPRYHLDRTLAHGVRYFWLDVDRVQTEVSFKPTAGAGFENLFVAQTSRDGCRMLRFRRTDTGVPPVAVELDQAMRRMLAGPDEGYSVLYTHLGIIGLAQVGFRQTTTADFPAAAWASLDEAAAEQRNGRTLFTTTERLLNHALMMAARPWTMSRSRERLQIDLQPRFEYEGLNFSFDWSDFMGFAVPCPSDREVWIGFGQELRRADVWDAGGQTYAGLRWQPIEMMALLDTAAAGVTMSRHGKSRR